MQTNPAITWQAVQLGLLAEVLLLVELAAQVLAAQWAAALGLQGPRTQQQLELGMLAEHMQAAGAGSDGSDHSADSTAAGTDSTLDAVGSRQHLQHRTEPAYNQYT